MPQAQRSLLPAPVPRLAWTPAPAPDAGIPIHYLNRLSSLFPAPISSLPINAPTSISINPLTPHSPTPTLPHLLLPFPIPIPVPIPSNEPPTRRENPLPSPLHHRIHTIRQRDHRITRAPRI